MPQYMLRNPKPPTSAIDSMGPMSDSHARGGSVDGGEAGGEGGGGTGWSSSESDTSPGSMCEMPDEFE